MMADQPDVFPTNVEQAVGDSFVDRQINAGMASPDNKLIEFLVTDRSIPKHMRKEVMWAFSDKEMALSNLDDKDIHKVMTSFSIANKFYMMGKPDYKHDWTDEMIYSNMRGKLFVKLKRSKDGFERRLEATQIRESHVDAGQQRRSGGIVSSISSGFSRLFGGR